VTNQALEISSPVGLIAAGGVMPFAVADSLIARGLTPVLFALKGACDPVAVERFRHQKNLFMEGPLPLLRGPRPEGSAPDGERK